MRNPSIPARLIATFFLSFSACAAIASVAADTSTATSLIDQLFEPPVPLRSGAAMTSDAPQPANHHRFSLLPTVDGDSSWHFTLQQPGMPALTLAPRELLQQSSTLFAGAIGGLSSTQQAQLEAAHDVAKRMTLDTLVKSNRPLIAASGSTGGLGTWISDASRHVQQVQVAAVMPMNTGFLASAPAENIISTINSSDVTRYLETHGESAGLLAQLLGWQKTGLLPGATDLQKMAADQVAALVSTIERWALHNVSLSSSSHAVADADSQQQMLQWHWSLTSHHQHHSAINSEASFSANLRRLFGMNEYY